MMIRLKTPRTAPVLVALILMIAWTALPAIAQDNAAKEKFNEGIQAEKDGKADVAAAAYAAAIQADPSFADPYLNLGVLQFGENDYPNAIKNFKKYTELAPDDYNGYKNLGFACVEAGDIKNGAAAFDGGLALEPKDEELLKGYANLYYRADNWEKSIERFNAYLAVFPDDSRALTNLARAYSEIGKTEEAIATYEKAIRADPKYNMPHFQLGNLYFEKKDYADAAKHFEMSADLDKTHWQSFYNLGNAKVAMETQEDYIDAYHAYSTFLKLTAKDRSSSTKKLREKAQGIIAQLTEYFDAEAIDY
jgi:tetratricopeptide (TPR) repeat protein